MVVKGSEQYRSIVVPHRPVRRALLSLGLLCVFVGVGFGSYRYGYVASQSNYRQAMEEWTELHELTSQQAEQLQQLNQQVANAQLGSSVDNGAMRKLQLEIVALNEQVSSLQESNNFYRQLMDQSEKNKGLSVGSFVVKALDQPRHFQYELVMQQLTREHRISTGKVNITLAGHLGEEQRSYSITELSIKPTPADIPLKLRFYQTITGNLVLPEGFVPRQVQVSAIKNGAAAVTADFDWVVKP